MGRAWASWAGPVHSFDLLQLRFAAGVFYNGLKSDGAVYSTAPESKVGHEAGNVNSSLDLGPMKARNNEDCSSSGMRDASPSTGSAPTTGSAAGFPVFCQKYLACLPYWRSAV